jgi:hypothetical protein
MFKYKGKDISREEWDKGMLSKCKCQQLEKIYVYCKDGNSYQGRLWCDKCNHHIEGEDNG